MEDILYKVFENYGWPGLLVALSITGLIFLFKKQNKQIDNSLKGITEEMTSAITSQNTELVKTIQSSQDKMIENQKVMLYAIIDIAKSDKEQKENHNKGLEKRKEMLTKSLDILKRICDGSNADRVAIIEFHNSKENLNGLPFYWYDVQVEYFKRGINPIMNKVKNLQASGLMPIIERLSDNDKCYTILEEKDLNELENYSPSLYYHLVKELEAKLLIYIGLYNKTNTLIGLLALEYTEDYDYKKHVGTIDETILLEQARNIEELLSFNDGNEK